MIHIDNFDFLVGKWKVINRRLKERLQGNDEWIEFEAHMETKKILGGLALMDEMKASYFGDEFIGLSIRMFNPNTNEWTIYWADTANPEQLLKEQVKGEFNNGNGVFYGKEIFKGQKVKLRFIWTLESDNHAKWEQAYFDDKNNNWETNWTMDFIR